MNGARGGPICTGEMESLIERFSAEARCDLHRQVAEAFRTLLARVADVEADRAHLGGLLDEAVREKVMAEKAFDCAILALNAICSEFRRRGFDMSSLSPDALPPLQRTS